MINDRFRHVDFEAVRWRTSSRSGGQGECVQVASEVAEVIPVRDSKRRQGPVLGFTSAAWRSFIDHLA
ncbi:DUF397 domain-containing protein [Yinghuangia aomiensis]